MKKIKLYIEKLESKILDSSLKYDEYVSDLLKDKSIDLSELKLYYLIQLRDLKYQYLNTSDENFKCKIKNQLDTYQYRLSKLNEKISKDTQNEKEYLLQILSDYESRLDEHLLVVTEDILSKLYDEYVEMCIEHCESQVENLMWCYYFYDKRNESL